jgi:small subunit ribosomal protein S10
MVNNIQKNNKTSVIRLSLLSYDYKLLEGVLESCMKAVSASGGYYKGPIRLPNRKHLSSLLRSPHVYKTAMDQFALTIHKVILDVYCGLNTSAALKEINISGGVEIRMSVRKGLDND